MEQRWSTLAESCQLNEASAPTVRLGLRTFSGGVRRWEDIKTRPNPILSTETPYEELRYKSTLNICLVFSKAHFNQFKIIRHDDVLRLEAGFHLYFHTELFYVMSVIGQQISKAAGFVFRRSFAFVFFIKGIFCFADLTL